MKGMKDLRTDVSQSGKTTAIRRITVRETSVSRHHGGPIGGHPETPSTSHQYRIKWFKRALNWAPIMPRDITPSDS